MVSNFFQVYLTINFNVSYEVNFKCKNVIFRGL